jgi:ABC-type glutathione transport system ATPase component
MLLLKNVNLVLDNKKVLDNLSLSLDYNERISIIGESGAGKTSLIKGVLGWYPLLGMDNNFLNMAAVFQDSSVYLNPSMKIYDQIFESSKLSLDEILKLFDELYLDQRILKQYPYELSLGMCQKVLFIISLSLKPDLLILDEATSFLDNSSKNSFINIINRLEIALISISHDINFIKQITDKVFMLKDGYLQQIKLDDLEKDPYTNILDNIKGRLNG